MKTIDKDTVLDTNISCASFLQMNKQLLIFSSLKNSKKNVQL